MPRIRPASLAACRATSACSFACAGKILTGIRHLLDRRRHLFCASRDEFRHRRRFLRGRANLAHELPQGIDHRPYCLEQSRYLLRTFLVGRHCDRQVTISDAGGDRAGDPNRSRHTSVKPFGEPNQKHDGDYQCHAGGKIHRVTNRPGRGVGDVLTVADARSTNGPSLLGRLRQVLLHRRRWSRGEKLPGLGKQRKAVSPHRSL